MEEKKIARINFLAQKAKNEGLSDEEKKEQHDLRQEYLDQVRKNVEAQLRQIKFTDEKPKNS